MKDRQRKAMFARMNTTTSSRSMPYVINSNGKKVYLPKPEKFKRVIDAPNEKIYKTGDAKITFIDDKRGRKPITVLAERKEGIDYRLMELQQYHTRAEGRKKVIQLKKNFPYYREE